MASGAMRVLVIDDSAEDRESYRRFLGTLTPAPTVDTASTAEEAMLRLPAGYDCCVGLPPADSNGLEVLLICMRGRCHPSVILLTGRGDEGCGECD